MKKTSVVIGLMFISFLLQSCHSTNSQTVESQNGNYVPPITETTPKSETKIQVSSNGKAEFKGVSFSYNPKIFGEVRAEEVAEYPLEQEDFKPDFVAPAHRLFAFDLSTGYNAMEIAVYPIDDFPRMYAINKSSAGAMQEQINDFKKVLRDKNHRAGNEIPFLPYRDASQAFQAKVRHLPFVSGQGILFVTFWITQAEFPSNRQLRYVYEGLTNDGKYYVVVEMPIKVDFLLDESSDEYEGHKIPWGKFDDEAVMKHFREVEQKIGKRLENTPSDKYEPNLKYFEEIISSLKIEK